MLVRKHRKKSRTRRQQRRRQLEFLEPRQMMAAFQAGNLVIYRVGDGSANLASSGNPVFLDEYTPAGALVQSIALPTTTSGSTHSLFAGGLATSEGQLNRSADGQYLAFTGYDPKLNNYTGSLSASTGTQVPRVVATADLEGTLDTSLALTDFNSQNTPRAAFTTDGDDFWFAGGAHGVRYAERTATPPTTSSRVNPSGQDNFRDVLVYDGQLYASSASLSSTPAIAKVGTGTPTNSGNALTGFTGDVSTTPAASAFFLADLIPGDSSSEPNTLYVTNDSTSGGRIEKYSLVSGSWVASGTIAATNVRGLTGNVNGDKVTLFATTGGQGSTGGGTLYSFEDTTGYNQTVSGTATSLVTADTKKAFRGVAFAPNIAPALLAGTALFTTLDENAPGTGNLGDSISGLLDSLGANPFGDSANALPGIAITAVDTTHGTWQYTTNGGAAWTEITSVSAGSALLLATESQTRIRFVPEANYTGTATITFRGWDRSQGTHGGRYTITTTGGAGAFSTATTTGQITVEAEEEPLVWLSLGQNQSSTVDEGTTVTFDLNHDPSVSISQWTIAWGDGTANTVLDGSATTVTHTFADGDDVANVLLTAQSSAGALAADAFDITIDDVAPELDINGVEMVRLGRRYMLELSAVDLGTDTITGWAIDWGNGTTSTITGNPLVAFHDYSALGEYTITATATNEDGTFDAANPVDVEVVENHAPVIGTLAASYVAYRGHEFRLTIPASDVDVPDDEIRFNTATGAPVTATIGGVDGVLTWWPLATDALDDYEIPILVSDNASPSLTDSVTLDVTLLEAPELAISGSATAIETGVYTLSLDPDTMTGEWTIDWGDGSEPQIVAATQSSVTHQYANGGEEVTITASLSDGYTTVPAASLQVDVTNALPLPTIDGTATVNEGATYTLDLSATAAAGDTVAGWTIDWGDGNIQTLPGHPSAVTHAYADSGVYTISAHAIDEEGTYTETPDTLELTVLNVAPTLLLDGPANWLAQHEYSLAVNATDVGDDIVTEWTIDWGDGSTASPLVGLAASGTHTYSSPGTYEITATAEDEDGSYLEYLTVAVATAAAPVLNPSSDRTLKKGGVVGLVAKATNSNTPAHAIQYSLPSGAPADAAIDPATGVFSWSPALSQAIGTYTITVRAAIAGAPALYDEETFEITLTAAAPVSHGIPDYQLAVGDPAPVVDLYAAFEDQIDADSQLQFELVSISNTTLLPTGSNPLGTFTPSSGKRTFYPAYGVTGTAEIVIRATNTNSVSTDITFSLEVGAVDGANGALVIQDMELVNNTADEGQTPNSPDGALRGKVVADNESALIAGTRIVEFDYSHAQTENYQSWDGRIDGTVISDAAGNFAFTPTNLPAGTNRLRARVRYWDESGDLRYSPWETLGSTFVLTPDPDARPVTPSIKTIGLNSDPGNDLSANQAGISGQIHNPSNLQHLKVEADWNGDGIVDKTEDTSSSYWGITPTNLDYGLTTIRVRMLTESGERSDWSSITFVYSANPDGAAAQALSQALLRQRAQAEKLQTIANMQGANTGHTALQDRDGAIRDYHQSLVDSAATHADEFEDAEDDYDSAVAAADATYDAAVAAAHATFVADAATQSLPDHDYPTESFSWAESPSLEGGPERPEAGTVGPEELDVPSFTGTPINLGSVSGYNSAVSTATTARTTSKQQADTEFNSEVSDATNEYNTEAGLALTAKNTATTAIQAQRTAAINNLPNLNPINLTAAAATRDQQTGAANLYKTAASLLAQGKHSAAMSTAGSVYNATVAAIPSGSTTSYRATVMANAYTALTRSQREADEGLAHDEADYMLIWSNAVRLADLNYAVATKESVAWLATETAKLQAESERQLVLADQEYNDAIASAVKTRDDKITTAQKQKDEDYADADADFDVDIAEAKASAAQSWATSEGTAWADYQAALISAQTVRDLEAAEASRELDKAAAEFDYEESLERNSAVHDRSVAQNDATALSKVAQITAAEVFLVGRTDANSTYHPGKIAAERDFAVAELTLLDEHLQESSYPNNGGTYGRTGEADAERAKKMATASKDRAIADLPIAWQETYDYYANIYHASDSPTMKQRAAARARLQMELQNTNADLHLEFLEAVSESRRDYELDIHAEQQQLDDAINGGAQLAEFSQETERATYTSAVRQAQLDYDERLALAEQEQSHDLADAQQTFDLRVALADKTYAIQVAQDALAFETAVMLGYVQELVTWSTSENTPWSTFVVNVVSSQATMLASIGAVGVTYAMALANADYGNAATVAGEDRRFSREIADANYTETHDTIEAERTATDSLLAAQFIRANSDSLARQDYDEQASVAAVTLADAESEERKIREDAVSLAWSEYSQVTYESSYLSAIGVITGQQQSDRNYQAALALDRKTAQAYEDEAVNKSVARLVWTETVFDAKLQFAQDSADADSVYATSEEIAQVDFVTASAEAAQTNAYDVAAAGKIWSNALAIADYGWTVLAAGADEVYSQGLSLALKVYQAGVAVHQNTYDLATSEDYADTVADWAALEPTNAHRQYLATVAVADQTWQEGIAEDWLEWMDDAAAADQALADSQALATKFNTLVIASADQSYTLDLATAEETQSNSLADADYDSQIARGTAAALRQKSGVLAESTYTVNQAAAEREYAMEAARGGHIWAVQSAEARRAYTLAVYSSPVPLFAETFALANAQANLDRATIVETAKVQRADALGQAFADRAEVLAAADVLLVSATNAADEAWISASADAANAFAESEGDASIAYAQSASTADQDLSNDLAEAAAVWVASTGLADRSYSGSAALADKTWTQNVAAAEGLYQLSEAGRLAIEADALATSTPTALNTFNAQYAQAKADWVALARYDYEDYWTARAYADINQRASAAEALEAYDNALAESRITYTATVAEAVAIRQRTDAESDADYAIAATERAGVHSLSIAQAESAVKLARAEAVGQYTVAAAAADQHYETAYAQATADYGNEGIAYHTIIRDFHQAVRDITAPANSQAWYDAWNAADNTKNAAINAWSTQLTPARNAVAVARNVELADAGVNVVTTQGDANVLYATAIAEADASLATSSATAAKTRQLAENNSDQDLSDLIAEAEMTMRRDGADAGYDQSLLLIDAGTQRMNDITAATTNFWSESSRDEATAMSALATTHNTPLNQFLAHRAAAFSAASSAWNTAFEGFASATANLVTASQTDVAVARRDAAYDLADRDYTHALFVSAASKTMADAVASGTAEYAVKVAPANIEYAKQAAVAERDYAARLAELKRDYDLSGDQSAYNANLAVAATSRTTSLDQARGNYGTTELSVTHELKQSLAEQLRDETLALVAENEDWSSDSALISHDLATTIAVERHELLTASSLAQKTFAIGRLGDLENLFADLAEDHPSIWADERYSVSQAASIQQTVYHNERYMLDLAKADANHDQAIRDADAAKALRDDLSESRIENATAQTNDAFAQFEQGFANDAHGANTSSYNPWHISVTTGPGVVKYTDITRTTFATPIAPSTDGYYSGAVSGMFGWPYTGNPHLGLSSWTQGEQSQLADRKNAQTWIIDHSWLPSPVTAGTNEATPANYWEAASAVISPIVQAGSAALQTQFVWSGYGGIAASAAVQALVAAASTSLGEGENADVIGARADAIFKIEQLIELLEKYGFDRDENGERFNFNATNLAEQLQGAFDKTRGQDLPLHSRILDGIGNPNLIGDGLDNGQARQFLIQLSKLREETTKVHNAIKDVDKLLDDLQAKLELIGLIPGLGDAADGTNFVIYTARGDFKNAAFSGLAMLPVIGTIIAGRRALKAAAAAEEIVEATVKNGKQVANAGEEVAQQIGNAPKALGKLVTDATKSRSLLRGAMANVASDLPEAAKKEAHHILPVKLFNLPIGKKLHKWGIDLNGTDNGVWLPSVKIDGVDAAVHKGRHTKVYIKEVRELLEQAKDRDDALRILADLRRRLLDGSLQVQTVK